MAKCEPWVGHPALSEIGLQLLKGVMALFATMFAYRIGPSLLAVSCIVGMGGCSSMIPTTMAVGTTSVTVLATSTANDQLSEVGVRLNKLELINQSGGTVDLLASPEGIEFIHLNGAEQPLATAIIPQGVYTAATATVVSAQFTCVTAGSTNDFASGASTASNVTVNLPGSLTIAGDAAFLSLDLFVSESAIYTACNPVGIEPYSITPVFSLSPVSNATAGGPIVQMANLEGIVSSLSTVQNGFTITSPDGPAWSVTATGNTVFQGILGFSALEVGMPVYMDVTAQSDGSLVANRVEVDDIDPTNLSIASGPILFVEAAQPGLYFFGREDQGYLYSTTGMPVGSQNFGFGNATFAVSGELANIKSLPFSPIFAASNITAGQNVSITSHASSVGGTYPWDLISTLTLIPQTINGTIASVSSSGGFEVYSVKLASYDLFPSLSVQSGQATATTNSGVVFVYVDASTRMSNTTALSIGNVMRFNGLIFNDSGTLRMDCAQVNDGVAE